MDKNIKKNFFIPLLIEQLSDAYCLEKESKRILPQLKEASADPNLERILSAQLEISEYNMAQLKVAGQMADIQVVNSDCGLMRIMVSKAEHYLVSDPVNDAGIMSHIERINYYKIAIYDAAMRFAKELNYLELHQKLQNLADQAYAIINRLRRLIDDQSDERAILNM